MYTNNFMLMALLCRLVRAAHKQGANIVLIQVCILEPWIPLVVFFQIISVCLDQSYWCIPNFRNSLKVITSVRHKERISFKELSPIKTILQLWGKISEILAFVICFAFGVSMPTWGLETLLWFCLRDRGIVDIDIFVHYFVVNILVWMCIM